MKKILSIVLAVCMMLTVCAMPALAEETAPISQMQTKDIITITVNGNYVDCSAYGQLPVIVEGRTLVPLRAVFEALGATVEWNNDTRTVVSQRGDVNISLAVDSTALVVNGEVKTIDVPAQIMNGRTMVPVRAVAEAFGCTVEWNNDTRTVVVTVAQEEIIEESEAEKIEAVKALVMELWAYTQTGDFKNVAKYYPEDSIYTQAENMSDIVAYGLDMSTVLDGLTLTSEQQERLNEVMTKFINVFIAETENEITDAYVSGEQVVVDYVITIPDITAIDVNDYLTEEELQNLFLTVFTESGYPAVVMYMENSPEMAEINAEYIVRVYELLVNRLIPKMNTIGVISASSYMNFEKIDGDWKVVSENGEPYKKITDIVD